MAKGSLNRQLPWDKDRDILDRVHGLMVILRESRTTAVARERAMAQFGYARETFYEDLRRAAIVRNRELAQIANDVFAELDLQYRETIHEADVLTAETTDQRAKALHQANKIKAIEARARLHGVEKPTEAQRDLSDAVRTAGITVQIAAGLLPEPIEASYTAIEGQ